MPSIHLGVYMTSGTTTSRAVQAALLTGYRAVDSAEWYGNEREVGNAMLAFLSSPENANANALKREDLWFTTKLKTNSGYEAARKSIKESVRRSGLGYLDLYLLHSPYGGKERRLQSWRAVEDAIEEGEVRVGGVSNYGVKHVSSAFHVIGTCCLFQCAFIYVLCKRCPKVSTSKVSTSKRAWSKFMEGFEALETPSIVSEV